MDTIQVSIILNEEKIKGLNPFDLQRKITFKLNRIFGLLGVKGQKLSYK